MWKSLVSISPSSFRNRKRVGREVGEELGGNREGREFALFIHLSVKRWKVGPY